MKRTDKTQCVVTFLELKGRLEKEYLIKNSCLNDRECQILILRYVNGLSLQETADKLGMGYEALCKAKTKAILRFYSYIFNE